MCRMYDIKPKKEESRCLLCALRGGYTGCRRSKSKKFTEKAIRLIQGAN